MSRIFLSEQERLAQLEVKVADLAEDLRIIDGKLDTLIALRHKGAGVVWIISGLFGTIGLVSWLLNILKAH